MNLFPNQAQIMLSLTVPIQSSISYIFGVDTGNGLNTSVLMISGQTTQQYYYNSTFQSQIPLATTTSGVQSPTIFNIGSEYYTLNLLIPISVLTNQKKIYYTEVPLNSSSLLLHMKNLHFHCLSIPPSIRMLNNVQTSYNHHARKCTAIIHLGFYLIFFFCCLIVSRWKPMNTRGISPFLTLFFLFTQLAMEIRNYLVIPAFQGSLCVYYMYGVYPLQQICFIMILLYFVRYFAIINIL
jgi:hypothetical protein